MTSRIPRSLVAAACVLGATSTTFALSRLPTPPLAERVAKAEEVFAGTVVNRVEKGEWVHAELRVDTPLRGSKKGALVPVIWRSTVGNNIIYDAKENDRGVALLTGKLKGRYWLRADKFEPIDKLETVKSLVAQTKQAQTADKVPTFDEWVKAGKPLPEGMMFTGGTPWFDERKGQRRSPEEVYRIIYGKPATPGKE